jgi:hypothetical protein
MIWLDRRPEGAHMPIANLLQQSGFNPDDTHILTTAFDQAWNKFKAPATTLRVTLAHLRRGRCLPSESLKPPEGARETSIG